MTKPQSKKPTSLDQIELHPDAWQRFEKFVDTSVKTRSTPKPKAATSRPKAATGKSRKKV